MSDIWEGVIIVIAIAGLMLYFATNRVHAPRRWFFQDTWLDKYIPLVPYFVIPYLGFLISTFLALIVFSYLMGDRKPLGMLSFSLGMTAAIYVVFGLIIYTSLPRGVWIFKALSTYIY